ncbi:hypothetical protein ZWY2020_054885 [Hordeum vulgare]|nr:hypothetical protein ZWY2020_054885 [Hordeum vulgare]
MREATDDGSGGKDGDTVKQHFARMPHMFSVPRQRGPSPSEEFEEYAKKAKTLPNTTTNESKLCLYSLYKQATVGPVNTDWMYYMHGSWHSWSALVLVFI